METDTMELNMNGMELANGGLNLAVGLIGFFFGATKGAAACGALGLMGGPIGAAIGAAVGGVVGGIAEGYALATLDERNK